MELLKVIERRQGLSK